MPQWFRADYLNSSFYDAVSSKTVSVCSAGNGVSIEFPDNVYDDVVAALEKIDFEYEREYEPNPGIQKTWSRYSDITFAHVITYPDSDQLRFSCQRPQHNGEPRTGKATSLHPSQRLPMSKRPVLSLDEIVFTSPDLSRRVQMFHDVAEEKSGEEWFIERYKDVRHSRSPRYSGIWQTSKVRSSNSFLKKSLPYQEFSVLMQGSGEADTADEQISSVSISGRWVPEQGWAAGITFNGDGNCWAMVAIVDPNINPFSFNVDRANPAISLTQTSVAASIQENPKLRYKYEIRLPHDVTPAGTEARHRHLVAVFDSPESLQDAMLKNLAVLRRIARDEITQPGNITMTDWSHARSDNPARSEPIRGELPSKDIRKKLLDAALAKLGAREQLIRENSEEIHAAVRKAFPLDFSKLP